MTNVLQCTQINKFYKTRAHALKDVSLQVPKGKIIGLLGPNGSGKTTLIKIASGLLMPTSGSIQVCGYEPGVQSKKHVSYLPDCDYLPQWMKVTDIISYFKNFYDDFDEAKALEMLLRLDLDKSMKLKTMSKGTKEKVQLILVMSRKSDLYLLDEPIGGVDPAARDYILDTIINNYREDSTVILSTHLISDIERVLDDVIFIRNGEIAFVESVENIRINHKKSVDELFREMYRI